MIWLIDAIYRFSNLGPRNREKWVRTELSVYRKKEEGRWYLEDAEAQIEVGEIKLHAARRSRCKGDKTERKVCEGEATDTR